MNTITLPLSPAGVAPVAPPRPAPSEASARRFAALMGREGDAAAVEATGPSSLVPTLPEPSDALGDLDRTLASTGQGPADSEGEGAEPTPMPVQPMAFDTPFMFHLRA